MLPHHSCISGSLQAQLKMAVGCTKVDPSLGNFLSCVYFEHNF